MRSVNTVNWQSMNQYNLNKLSYSQLSTSTDIEDRTQLFLKHIIILVWIFRTSVENIEYVPLVKQSQERIL